MGFEWGKPGLVYRGATGSEISEYHKIWIMQDDICVAGYLGEGTSREIVSNWDAPFADTSLESKYRAIGGIIQLDKRTAGMTTLSKLNSRQVWTGNQPYTFNLVMKFRAFTDPKHEVEDAINALEMMIAPELNSDMDPINAWLPVLKGNRVPKPVAINFARKQLLTDCCIKSMSTPFDKEKNKDGYLIRADVTLQVETLSAVTKADLRTSQSQSQ